MERVFLSFSYRPADQATVRPIISLVEAVVEAHGARVVTGENLGGGPLTASIMGLIDQCDTLIAVVTPDQPRAEGGFTAHTYVRDELNYARGKQKRAVPLWHKDVVPDGAWQENEYIKFDPSDSLSSISRLVKMIGRWQREDGRLITVMLLPEEVGTRVVSDDRAVCRYRLVNGRSGVATDWKLAQVSGQVGGSFAYVSGAQEDSLLEIRVEAGGSVWSSRATPQYVHAELRERGRP